MTREREEQDRNQYAFPPLLADGRLPRTQMRIDRIHLSNFKLFEDFELTLNPEFTLLIGENGSGKTSILDALAIACGVWPNKRW